LHASHLRRSGLLAVGGLVALVRHAGLGHLVLALHQHGVALGGLGVVGVPFFLHPVFAHG